MVCEPFLVSTSYSSITYEKRLVWAFGAEKSIFIPSKSDDLLLKIETVNHMMSMMS